MQPTLPLNAAPAFDGPSLEPSDQVRLSKHLQKVIAFMADGKLHTLAEVAEAAGCSESAAGARLRDLRKPRFGSFQVDRFRSGNLFTYRVRP